jgi:tetratricopeptide (TPR) repeat protein
MRRIRGLLAKDGRACLLRLLLAITLICFSASCATTGSLDEPRDPPRVEKLRLQITKVRNAVEETRRAIARSRGADFLPELYVRLAELLSEEAKYHYQLAYEREQRADRSMTVPQVRLLKEDAIGIYERVLREFPDSNLAPRVLFNIGHEHRELGNFEEMKSALRRLALDHPASSLRYDALLVLGDYHFDKQEFKTADTYYDKIVDGGLNRHSGIAHYKRAWVRVNQGSCKTALGQFEDALVTSAKWEDKKAEARKSAAASGAGLEKSASEEGGTQQDIDVRREALVDMTYCYSRERKVKGSLDYFRKHAYNRSTYISAVSRLASRYRMMDKFDGAVAASRELLTLGPADDLRLDDARTFYSALKQQKKFDRIGEDIELITNILTRHYSRPEIDPEARAGLVSEFEAYVRDLATTAQEALDKSGDTTERARALADAYNIYLDTFSDAEHTAEMLLNLAEVSSKARNPFEAGRRAAQAAELVEEDEAKKNALYDAVVYFQESLQNVNDPSKYRRVAARATLRRAGAELLGYEISADKERRVKFAMAQSFYDEGRYDQAIDRLTAVAYQYPKTKEADAAVQLVLDSYNTLNDFDGLMYSSRRFLGEGSPASDGFKGEIQETLAAAEQRKLDELSLEAAGEDGGDFSQLTRFAEQNPNTEVGERALVNAFVAARAVGDTDKVYEMADKLAEQYPNSEQLPGIYNSLAQTANTRFEFDQAITYLERAAKVNEGQRAHILAAAAELQAELGQASKAESTYKAAIEQSEGHTRGVALAGFATLLEKYKSSSELVRRLAQYKDNTNPDFQARLGLAYLAEGNAIEAESAFTIVLTNEASASAEALGRAHYGMAELMRQTLDQYPAPSDLSMVQEFIALVELTQQNYLQAARQGSPAVTAAALSRLAVANDKAADKLLAIQLPAELSSSDKAQIMEAMKARAENLRTSGNDAFEACGQQAFNSYNFTPVVRKCLQGERLTQVMIPLDAIKGGSSGSPEGFEKLRGELSKNPEDVERLQSLGEQFFDKGHHHAARLVFQKAVQAGGGPTVYNFLGRANEAVGDLSAALEAYSLAAEAGYEPARENLSKVLTSYGLAEAASEMKKRFAGGSSESGS